MLTLYGCRGCGSIVIEIMLEMSAVPYRIERWDWEDDAAWARYSQVNPFRQVPMLVLEDGTQMTESVAIMVWLLDRYPEMGLLPHGASQQAQMYRWLVYLATNIYPAIGIGDFPERWVQSAEAQEALTTGALERVKAAWLFFESQVGAPKYLLGDALTALDLYTAMMMHWRPRQPWFAAHCPKVYAAALFTEDHPVVKAIFSVQFDK